MSEVVPYRSSGGLAQPGGAGAAASPVDDLNYVEKWKARRKLSQFQQEKLVDVLNYANATQRQDLVYRLSDDTTEMMIEAAHLLEEKILKIARLPEERRARMEATLEKQFEEAVERILTLQSTAINTLK
jgi:hypothetical protein